MASVKAAQGTLNVKRAGFRKSGNTSAKPIGHKFAR